MNDGVVVIGAELDTKSFDAQIGQLENELKDVEYELEHATKNKLTSKEVEDYTVKAERLKNRIIELRKQKEKLNQTSPMDLSGLESTSDSISKIIKKVSKWALAVFGVRSAYMFVRQSASTLAQYNEKIASDLEYIRFALASSLQPVIEGLIQLVYKLLTYVNYIAKAWFGVDLFANASAKAMNKGAKSAEKMKKSLAGFDEMNVMSDTSSGGAGGGAGIPSMDLSAPEDVPIPSWIQWIADNKDIVIAGLLGIAGGLTAVNFGLTAIQGLGIGLILTGIVMLIQDIIVFINDPSWENFIAILGDISIGIGGIMLVMGNWWGLLVSIIGLVVKLVAENWDAIKGILSSIWNWFKTNVIDLIWGGIKGLFNGIVETCKQIINGIVTLFNGMVNAVKNVFTAIFNGIKSIMNPLVNFFSGLWNKIKTGIKNFAVKVGDAISQPIKAAINSLMKIVEGVLNTPIKAINGLLNVINKIPGVSIGKLDTIKLPRLARGGIVNMPGRGINYGGANIGEFGSEGVIPLTNSQQMELLGEAIGKYITIIANITNTMNGRVISRELQKIQNSSDFATNS